MKKFHLASHLQIDSVSHQFGKSSVPVLQDVRFTVEPGTSAAIIGRSGCGKSTLLQIACGMLMPTSGAVYVDGTKVEGPSPRWNMMFQEALLFPWMSVFQNATLGLRFAGQMSQAEQRVLPLLEMVGLSDFSDTNVQDLSGGQQQRVALARSLATQPSILLLDEPFSALDAVTRRGLQRDIRRIIADIGITLVTVTHDLDEAILLGDQVIAMVPNPGEIAEIIDTQSVSEGNGDKAISDRLMTILNQDVVPHPHENNANEGLNKTSDSGNVSYVQDRKGEIHA